jgi:hypothetical protein
VVRPAVPVADTGRVTELHIVTEAPPCPDPPFDEWGRLTRFLESGRLAFARERNLWASLGIDKPEKARISAPEDQARYSVTLQKHIDALNDVVLLHASVLVHSYALAKFAAADRLGVEPRTFHGIEDWGRQLLDANGRGWTDVDGGLPGAVETAVVRNAFAHGARTLDAEARARLRKAGAQMGPEGAPVTLTYSELHMYRERLKSLLNAGGIGRLNSRDAGSATETAPPTGCSEVSAAS